MPNKKQQSAGDVIESFRNYARSHLSREDRLFCDRLISQGANEHQIHNLTSDYINEQGHKRSLSLTELDDLARYIANYITVYLGLLLSYSPPKSTQMIVHKKYYRAAPRSLGMVLVTIPHRKIIITNSITPGEGWYGSKRDNAGFILFVEMYKYTNKWILLHRGNFIDTQYPRFSISCPISNDCPAYVESSMMFDTGDGISDMSSSECKMSPNRTQLCMFEKVTLDDYGIGLPGFLAITLMCYDRWKKRPMSSGSKKHQSYSDMGVSLVVAKTPQWEHVSGGFREVQLHDYPEFIQQDQVRASHLGNRASPCEHERRGHMRTLRDGRMIYVRPSIVNKGGEKVVYRVNG